MLRGSGGPRVVVSTVAFHAIVHCLFPGLGSLKETKNVSSPSTRKKLSIVGSLCDREVACAALDCQSLNCESSVSRAVSSHLSHHPQEVLLAQFSLHVHKKPDSFIFHNAEGNDLVLWIWQLINIISDTYWVFSCILTRMFPPTCESPAAVHYKPARYTNTMPVQCWATVAGQHPFNTEQWIVLAGCRMHVATKYNLISRF